MVKIALKVKELLEAEGRKVSVVNARFVKPIDEEMVKKAAKKHKYVVTLEENVLSGGYGENVREYFDTLGTRTKLMNIAIPDCFVEHGKVDELLAELHMDAAGVTERILEWSK